MDKFIGKRLDGRYEFKELIGIGGMANVYKAYDIVEQKDVAIKILKEEFLGNEEFVKRFRNESKAVATLSHPNIVRIFDVNFGDRIQYIVMEYIDGITLKEFIEKSTVLSWKDTVHFTVQILRALQHAHDKGIVHRDIKPQTIMLLADGTIKVMDFGIARFARDEHKATTDKAIGSVHYISPEQASGEPTDEKSDLYSVGVMMYEMLTGRLPFDGETPEQVAVKQMQAIAPAPRTINEEIPEGLEEIIVRAMQKDPNKRYQSAAEMLRDIDEFKKNPSIVFEYKYFNDEGSTKYFDTAKLGEDGDEDEEEPKKKSKFIPILLGVAVTFCVVAVILIAVMLNMKPDKPKDIVLDNFIGMNVEDVTSDPKYAKIKFDLIWEFNSEYEKDQVFKQDPEEGMSVKENSKITLHVSKGSNLLTIPDVTNISVDDATKKLKDKGFTNLKTVRVQDGKVTKDTVIRTDPQSGEQVESDALITIYVSYGEDEKVKVKDVVGKHVDEATKILQDQGFKVNQETVESNQAAGTVVKQSPAGGELAASTSVITLKVSSGTVPAGSADVSLSLPSGMSGTYKFRVVDESGKEIRNESVTLGSASSYTFQASGQGVEKTYKVYVSEGGSNEKLFAEVSVDFNSQNPTPIVKTKNDSVFEKKTSEPPSNNSKPDDSSSSDGGNSSSNQNSSGE